MFSAYIATPLPLCISKNLLFYILKLSTFLIYIAPPEKLSKF